MPERFAGLASLLQKVLPQLGEIYTGMPMHLDDASWVGNRLAEILPIAPAQKQHCLELEDPIARLELLTFDSATRLSCAPDYSLRMTLSAAATVASMCASVWAADKKPASKAEGAR